MSKSCDFVVTDELAQKYATLRPDHNHPRFKPGIATIDLAVDPQKCETKFGRWLAERISTTRRDDDASILRLTLPRTEADISLAAFCERLKAHSIRDASDHEAVMQQVERWIGEQRKVRAAYGDMLFSPRTIHFEWPVLGSRAAEGIDRPEAYFDLCGRQIRWNKPTKVLDWQGNEPPASLQISG